MDIRSRLVKFYYFVLTRRYTINTVGLELFRTSGAKLVLPNHQSHIDPQLIAVILAPHCEIVPVVSENFLKIPIINYFIKQFNAVSVIVACDSVRPRQKPKTPAAS